MPANTTWPKVLLFDLGGVLVDWAAFDELEAFLPHPLSPSEVRDRWILDPSVAALERGSIEPGVFAERFVRDWHLQLTAAEFSKLFDDWFRGLYVGAEELILRLRRQTGCPRLMCLSNSNILHWEKFRSTAERLFDRSLLSFELGEVKPERALFEAVAATLGCAPSEALFYDDTPINVTKARDFGFTAIRVQGVAELEQSLNEHGLLSR